MKKTPACTGDGVGGRPSTENEDRFSRAVYDLLHENHPHYGEKHYQSLKKNHTPFVVTRLACRHSDATSQFVNIKGGLRKTVGARRKYTGRIHLVGSSHAFGAYCDDEHTVASCLQALCNRHSPLAAHKVINHGTAGSSIENTFRIFTGIRLRKNDLVLLLTNTVQRYFRVEFALAMQERCRARGIPFAVFFQPNLLGLKNPTARESALVRRHAEQSAQNFPDGMQATGSLLDILRAGGVPAYDLQNCVERPHPEGEIFIDPWHVSFKGNRRIAQAMLDSFLKLQRPAAFAWAHKTAMADLRETVRALYHNEQTIKSYLDKTPRFPNPKSLETGQQGSTGAIVMNCNPFTLGHLYIVRQALEQVEKLYLFVVSEDRSQFSFVERASMILEGIGEMRERVLVAASGAFIISSLSFPEYFCKDSIRHSPDASLEALIFGAVIAPALGIGTRFFGEEPLCRVTRAYHRQLRNILPSCGVACVEIPRLRQDGEPVSASKVRALFKAGELEKLARLVPLSTLRCLTARLRQKA